MTAAFYLGQQTGDCMYKKISVKSYENIIMGINPVIEALNSDKHFEKILLSNSANNKNINKLINIAKEHSVLIKRVDRKKLDDLTDSKNHQGCAAILSSVKYSTVQEILDFAQEKGESPFLIIADCIEDPHNLGAIIRTAECSGAHGIIIPQRHCCGITPVVSKTSAGAAGHLHISKVVNLSRTVDDLKKAGLWIYCADMNGKLWNETDFTGPSALIVGNEGKGVSRLLKEKSDFTVALPLKGKVNSLNASVAAGILMYEVLRQRSI